jgi:hypothetical protein
MGHIFMNEKWIEEVFDWHGYSELYKKFRYPISISGEFDDIDSDLLEAFLENFSIDEPLIFDEFRYYFRIFRTAYERNELHFM